MGTGGVPEGPEPKYIYVIFEDMAPSNKAGEGKLFGGRRLTGFAVYEDFVRLIGKSR